MGEQTTLFDIIEDEETFDFEGSKQNLIDNLDMLKEMSVEEQTLYKKWQEMNKGGKMAKIKNKLYTYRYNLWLPSDLDNLNQAIYRFKFEELLLSLDLGDAEIKSTRENWSEAFVRFLTNPVVASLLTTFGFLGILFELQSPGWGIPGSVGIVCLTLSLSASFIARLATMTDMLIIFAGISLLVLEIVIIPGFGFAGIGGIGLILWGLYELLLPDIPIGPEVEAMAMWGFIIGIIGGLIGLVLLFKLMVKTNFWKKLTSPGVEGAEEGYSTSVGWENLEGMEGISQSDLRPSGWALVDGQRIFVVSEGDFIEKECKLKIHSVDGNRVVVRKLNSEE